MGIFVACSGGEGRLETLKSDPMATYLVPTAIDSRTSEVAGGFSEVSSPSTYRITFTVPGGEAEATIDEIANAATDAGWELRPQGVGYGGDKRIDGIDAQIVINGILQDDTVWIELRSRSQ